SPIVVQRIDLPDERMTRTMLNRDAPANALLAIFRHVGAPVSLDALTDATASLWGVSDAFRPMDETARAVEPAPLARAEARHFVPAVWGEIQQLRPPHRAALLLNLRDGEGVSAVPHFLLLGVASFDEIAAAAGVAAEELSAMWSTLPLDDLKIAAMLG